MSKYLSYNGLCNTDLIEKLVPKGIHVCASFEDSVDSGGLRLWVKVGITDTVQITKEIPITGFISDDFIDREMERIISECLTALLEHSPTGNSEYVYKNGDINIEAIKRLLPCYIDVELVDYHKVTQFNLMFSTCGERYLYSVKLKDSCSAAELSKDIELTVANAKNQLGKSLEELGKSLQTENKD